MKAKVIVKPVTSPDQFAGVAEIIARGIDPPPEWIIRGLQQFSEVHRLGKSARADKALSQMHEAAKTLMQYLPAYQHLPFGIGCPDQIAVVLRALPVVMRDLERLTRKRSGRPRDTGRDICAAVVLEIWKLVHGKAEPRSLQLQEACNAYWLACGGSIAGEGDPENWRRAAERAAAGEQKEWIREILQAVRNSG